MKKALVISTSLRGAGNSHELAEAFADETRTETLANNAARRQENSRSVISFCI